MDPRERLDWLASNSLCLGPLSSELTDPAAVTAYLTGEDLWISSDDYGCLRTDKKTRELDQYPIARLDPDEFNEAFVAAWIPQIQQFWGRQVLHASTVHKPGTQELVAFSGDKMSGKSTLAFGLAQKPGWQQLGDDMLVFEVSNGGISIIPYPETPRLRSESSEHFGTDGTSLIEREWPETDLRARLVYSLSPTQDLEVPAQITPLSGADAYTPLLRQAFNLGLELPDLKRRLIEDYAAFTNQTRVFRLIYRREIHLLPQILDEVEAHADAT